jgi:hypothetical protein
MAYSLAATKDPRPLWSRLAERFPNEKECLAAYVALETAEVLAEAKPASLLSISNYERACGRNLYTLWKEYGHELLADTPLQACELVDRGSSLMILFSHKIHFKRHLARRDISSLPCSSEPVTASTHSPTRSFKSSTNNCNRDIFRTRSACCSAIPPGTSPRSWA